MNWFNVVVYFSCHCIVDVRNSSLSFLSWVMFLESIHPVSIINTGITCMKWMANQIYISQICVSFVRVWLFIITSGSWLYYIGIDFLRNILELSQDSDWKKSLIYLFLKVINISVVYVSLRSKRFGASAVSCYIHNICEPVQIGYFIIPW